MLKQVVRACLTALLFALFLLPSYSQQKLDKDLEFALRSIKAADAYDLTKAMASPEFAGRLTGHEGYTAAAKWAARKFEAWRLKSPGGKEGYLQSYSSPYTVVERAEMTLLLPEGRADKEKGQATREMVLAPEKDFLPLLYTDSGNRTAETVFAGWGISAPELNYDDYAGLDVKGRFVFCFRGTPDGDKKYQYYDEHRTRMKAARDKGALGIIYIYPNPIANPNGDWLQGFTPAMISEKAMDAALQEINATTADLQKSLTEFRRPISFPLRTKIRLSVESRHFPQGIGYNVVGYVQGSDPKLNRECVVIGGHFDHCGRHMGLLFAGADDNGSGSAVVMEAAQAFAHLKLKPKRSVAFILFGGEEMGLQGSTYFVDHPPAALAKLDGMFNFDMEGEGDGLGGALSAEPVGLKQAIEEADKYVHILRGLGVLQGVGVRGSDFGPFFLKGIPSATLGSNGPHLAYHQTGDTIYRINPDMMADAARLAFLSAYFWANR